MANNIRRLAGPVAAAGSAADAVLFTTTTNCKAKVRSIIVNNSSTSAATFSIGVNATSTTAANCIVSLQSVPANTPVYIYPELVLTTGQTLNASGSTTAVVFTVNGEEVASVA